MRSLVRTARIAVIVCVAITFSHAGTKKGAAFHPVSELPEGQGIVYIYRVDGMKQVYLIKADDEPVTKLKSGGYVAFMADPGMIELNSKLKFKMFTTGILNQAWSGKRTTDLWIQPGHVYYLRGKPSWDAEKLDLEIMEAEDAYPEIKDCRELEWK